MGEDMEGKTEVKHLRLVLLLFRVLLPLLLPICDDLENSKDQAV